jgi:hypothetical protein
MNAILSRQLDPRAILGLQSKVRQQNANRVTAYGLARVRHPLRAAAGLDMNVQPHFGPRQCASNKHTV